MLTVFEVTLPVFALVLCGWVAARRRMLSPEAASGINAFVFQFALPAMLYRAVATQSFERLVDARFLAAYIAAALLMLFGSRLLARRVAPQDPIQRIGLAFSATHGNLGYLGLPLMAQLGDLTRMPAMVMALLVDILVVIVLSIVMFEFARSADSQDSQRSRHLRAAIGGLLRTPLILGIMAGLVMALSGWTLPGPADTFVRLLSSAAGPCALFAIGASLGERRVSIDAGVPTLVALKLLIHPALVAALMWALDVEPRLAAVGVLAASLPTASNAFILSQRYGADTRPVGAAIAVGTALAVVTVSMVIWLFKLTAH